MINLILITVLAISSFASSYNGKMLGQIKMSDKNSTSFSFAVMGDNRDGNHILKKIITSINQDKNIEFSLNNGDLVPDGYKKEFFRYNDIISKSSNPFVSIIGNHEIPWYMSENNYKEYFGKPYFSYIYANSYFIILDDSEGEINNKQERWLISELKKSQNYRNRFVFMHVPLYDPREGKYKKGHSLDDTNQAKQLNDLFDKYKVTMLFTSHIHMYYKGKWQNTPYIITGGAGAPLKHYKDYGFYHYIKVIVKKDKIEYKVIKIDAKPLGFIDSTIQDIQNYLNL